MRHFQKENLDKNLGNRPVQALDNLPNMPVGFLVGDNDQGPRFRIGLDENIFRQPASIRSPGKTLALAHASLGVDPRRPDRHRNDQENYDPFMSFHRDYLENSYFSLSIATPT